MSSAAENLVEPGEILKGKWKVIKKIGSGGFGQVFEAEDVGNRQKVAIKMEAREAVRPVLRMEVAVLRKLQGSPNACAFYGCGRNEAFNYLVMELQGTNLSELRRDRPLQKFSLSTALLLTYDALTAVQAVHEIGYLHRDVKPSNFAIGRLPDTKRKVYILDFGLAREYLDDKSNLRPAREMAAFRGTVRYASLNAHRSKELGRHDDLVSLFYMVVEFVTGVLPWKKIKNKDEVAQMKRHMTTQALLHGLYPDLQKIYLYLKDLSYWDTPSYERIRRYIRRTMSDHGVKMEDPYDWERSQKSRSGEASMCRRPPSTMRACCTGRTHKTLRTGLATEAPDQWSDVYKKFVN